MTDFKIKKVFVDTAPFIYFFNGDGKDSLCARDMFLYYVNNDISIVTSEITNIECRVKPKINGSINKLMIMDDFIDEFNIEKYMLAKKTYEIALEIRCRYNISLIDAFQLAIAEENKCDLFITNDKELLKYKGIKVELFTKYKNI